MRSLPRAVPLLVLGLAVLLGAGHRTSLAAPAPRAAARPRPRRAASPVLVVLCLPPLWTGDIGGREPPAPRGGPAVLDRRRAVLDLDGQTTDDWATRVLELPGSDFASYRWGNTVDPITPGLMDRPYVARELIPYGSPPSADLLNAFDRRLQEGTLDAGAIAPLARLMGVGDIVLRYDLQYERYNLARPRADVGAVPRRHPASGRCASFGGTAENVPDPTLPLHDELELAARPTCPTRRRSRCSRSSDPVGIVRAIPADRARAAGRRRRGPGRPGVRRARRRHRGGPVLGVVRRRRREPGPRARPPRRGARAHRHQPPAPAALEHDAGERRLHRAGRRGAAPRRPHRQPPAALPRRRRRRRARSPSTGAASTPRPPPTATRSPTRPRTGPANAVDGDRRTAWQVGAFSPVQGERIELSYDEPRTTDQHHGPAVRQRRAEPLDHRRCGCASTAATRSTSTSAPRPGASPARSSRFDRRTFRDAHDRGAPRRRRRPRPLRRAQPGGLRRHPPRRRRPPPRRGHPAPPRPPRPRPAPARRDQPLAIVLTRQRTRPSVPLRSDPELAMARAFALPTARAFGVSGQARISATRDRRGDRPRARASPPPTGRSWSPPAPGACRATSGRGRSAPSTATRRTHWSPAYLDQGTDSLRYQLERPGHVRPPRPPGRHRRPALRAHPHPHRGRRRDRGDRRRARPSPTSRRRTRSVVVPLDFPDRHRPRPALRGRPASAP